MLAVLGAPRVVIDEGSMSHALSAAQLDREALDTPQIRFCVDAGVPPPVVT